MLFVLPIIHVSVNARHKDIHGGFVNLGVLIANKNILTRQKGKSKMTSNEIILRPQRKEINKINDGKRPSFFVSVRYRVAVEILHVKQTLLRLTDILLALDYNLEPINGYRSELRGKKGISWAVLGLSGECSEINRTRRGYNPQRFAPETGCPDKIIIPLSSNPIFFRWFMATLGYPQIRGERFIS